MLARCAIPLSSLLRSKPLVRLTKQPMISLNTGEVIAHINMDARLAIPISELYRLFLERHPTERRQIEDVSTRRALEAVGEIEHAKVVTSIAAAGTMEEEARLYNELEITVLKAIGLPNSVDNNPPTAYVHFQFLGNPDKVTAVIPNTNDPTFNERFVFPIITNDQQLRLLQRSKLQLTVIDIKGEELDDKNDGLIGEVFVSLSEIAEGISVMDIFNIKNDEGSKMGEIQLSMRWKHTFRKQRELGPNALSAVEVESLISAFSPGVDKEGVVDYKSFCRFVDPPSEVRRTMEKLRIFCNRFRDRENIDARGVFRSVLGDREGAALDEDTFTQKMLTLSPLDCMPVDFSRLFKFIDMDEDGHISLDQLIAVMNLDEVAGIQPALQEKLSHRSRDLNKRRVSVLSLFEQADQWGDRGLVTRLEFKNVLKRMGFSLVDEPSSVNGEFSSRAGNFGSNANGRVSNGPANRYTDDLGASIDDQNDALNDTLGSDDVLLDNEGIGRSNAADRNRNLTEQYQRQRQYYEQRRGDIEKQGRFSVAEETMLQKKGNSGRDSSAAAGATSGAPPTTAVGVNMLDISDMRASGEDPYSSEVHGVGIQSHGTKHRIHDKSAVEASATKLQSRFRGFRTRKQLSPELNRQQQPSASTDNRTGAGSKPKPAVATSIDLQSTVSNGVADRQRQPSQPQVERKSGAIPRPTHPAAFSGKQPPPDNNLSDGSLILQAEDVIRESIKALEGSQPVPNILGGFQTVDPKQTGFVTRAQFAHVVSQYKMIKLYGQDLRTCMDYFDKSHEGTHIDYNAFVRFVRFVNGSIDYMFR